MDPGKDPFSSATKIVAGRGSLGPGAFLELGLFVLGLPALHSARCMLDALVLAAEPVVAVRGRVGLVVGLVGSAGR